MGAAIAVRMYPRGGPEGGLFCWLVDTSSSSRFRPEIKMCICSSKIENLRTYLTLEVEGNNTIAGSRKRILEEMYTRGNGRCHRPR